jgi:Mrr N-terminal domain
VTRIPHAKVVAKAIRSVRSAIQKSLEGVNQLAGQRMAKGDYQNAELLIAKAKELRQFQSEVDAVAQKWREVCATGKGKQSATKQTTTPLWQYYQPILRSLIQLGGECRRPELETSVHDLMAAVLLPGDNSASASGQERWRKMIQRSRKHLIAEGWIEKQPGTIWRITESGRRAAEKSGSKSPAT